MEYLAAIGFFVLMYGICGFVSKMLFEDWCNNVFDEWRVAEAVAVLLAVFWPLGWLLVIVVGVVSSAVIAVRSIGWSVAVLVNHFRQAERGEQ